MTPSEIRKVYQKATDEEIEHVEQLHEVDLHWLKSYLKAEREAAEYEKKL